jgi:chromosome segregation ATPase
MQQHAVRPALPPGAAAVLAVLAALFLLPGCAMKRDLDVTIDEVVALKRKQADDYQELKSQVEQTTNRMQAGQSDLSAGQKEVKNQAQSISAELARLGTALTALQQQSDDLARRVKDLQNTQAIGLGSLSKRMDDTGTDLKTTVVNQGQKLDRFATEVSGQVDSQGKQVTTLSRSVADLSARDQQQAKAVADLSRKLDVLGRKLTSEVSAQQKQITQGPAADPAEVAALKKQVGFLGDTLPQEVDGQGKRLAALEKQLRDVAALLSDLNGRMKALEAR